VAAGRWATARKGQDAIDLAGRRTYYCAMAKSNAKKSKPLFRKGAGKLVKKRGMWAFKAANETPLTNADVMKVIWRLRHERDVKNLGWPGIRLKPERFCWD
jgi:hypothetical protein